MNGLSQSPDGAYHPGRPHVARMYDYLLGGKDNNAADRAAAGRILALAPEVRATARANRDFMARSVRYLAAERGISQFLDIGTGIPASPNVHEIVQQADPRARAVYVDNDPVVLAHARALLTAPEGGVAYIDADLRDPAKIIREAGETLDFREPVALLLAAVLHFIPDADDPGGITAALLEALAPGSYLVLSHGTTDFHPAEVTGTATAAYDGTAGPLVLRPRTEVEEFFGGLKLEPPGVVQAPLWRPDKDVPENLEKIGIYAGVAAKR